MILLQEVTTFHKGVNEKLNGPEFLAKSLGYNYYYVPAHQDEKTGQGFGNVILTKFPIKNSANYFLQTKDKSLGESYDNENRLLLKITINTENQDVDFYTTHLSYTHQFQETEKKITEVRNLLDIVKTFTMISILSGDFNLTPSSDSVKSISNILKNLAPGFGENTWTTKPFSYNGFEVNTLDYRLDYIFGTKNIKLIETKILSTEYSDHLPIFSRIRI